MNDYEIELGLSDISSDSTPKYFAFVTAVLFISDNIIYEDPICCFDTIESKYKSQPKKIDSIVRFLEKETSGKLLTVYKKNNDENFIEADFKKYDFKNDISDLWKDKPQKEPLYNVYKHYYYKFQDLRKMQDKYHHKLNNNCVLANGFTNAPLKLMYEFTAQYPDLKKFLKLPLETQIFNITDFAKGLNLKITQNVAEAIAIILAGKLERKRGAQKR